MPHLFLDRLINLTFFVHQFNRECQTWLHASKGMFQAEPVSKRSKPGLVRFRGSRDPREGSAGKQVLSHRSSVHTFRSLLTRSVRGKSIPHCPHTPSQTARHSCSEIQDTGVTGRVWGIYKRGKEKFTTRKPRRNSEDHGAGIYTFTQ